MKCKKDKTGIDALPPATQEGKNTFGCLVNGQAFVPSWTNLGGPPTLSSYYQYIDHPTLKGYFFNVSANKRESGRSSSVTLLANHIIIKENSKYVLRNYADSNAIYGRYAIVSDTNINEFVNKDAFQGELYVSKFDEIKQIVSGTFWFDALNGKGEKVEVRDGRFDVYFVR
jgi:hypothetical protein